MTDRKEADANSTEAPAPGTPNENDLPYRVTLWIEENTPVAKVLARAASIVLARAIFVAALTENPGRRIVLNRGQETISDSLDL